MLDEIVLISLPGTLAILFHYYQLGAIHIGDKKDRKCGRYSRLDTQLVLNFWPLKAERLCRYRRYINLEINDKQNTGNHFAQRANNRYYFIAQKGPYTEGTNTGKVPVDYSENSTHVVLKYSTPKLWNENTTSSEFEYKK